MENSMIHILICEDEKRHRDHLREMLVKLSFLMDVDIRTYSFSSAEELIRIYEAKDMNYDILFQDIELPGINGLQTAKILRDEYDYDGQLVFLTNHMELMQDSFEVGTNQYLVKPVKYEEFEKKIRPIINTVTKNNQRITVELVSGGFQILPIASILTIHSKSLGRKGGVVIKTDTQEFTAYGKMYDYLEKLEKQRFYRIHKQTIVNLEHIVFFDGKQVVLTNQQALKVSRNVKHDLKKRIMNF